MLDIRRTTEVDEETDLVPDEHEEGVAQLGKSAHRCSMIKSYNIPTFFTPQKGRRNVIPHTEIKKATHDPFSIANMPTNSYVDFLQPE